MSAAATPSSDPAAGAPLPRGIEVRAIEVRPPSARGEALGVLRVAALIVGASWIYLANAVAPAGREARLESSRPPYQKLFRELAPPAQRMFRELQEGLLEAENARAASGRWPEAAALAAQGIPPFAADPAAGAAARAPGRYGWTLRRAGLVVNYLGVPARGGQPVFLLLIQEPDPLATPHGAAPADEEHHTLADGTLLHVSIWMRPGGPPPRDGAVAVPAAEGWTQLLVGPASAEGSA
jgi:hypothetical protein